MIKLHEFLILMTLILALAYTGCGVFKNIGYESPGGDKGQCTVNYLSCTETCTFDIKGHKVVETHDLKPEQCRTEKS